MMYPGLGTFIYKYGLSIQAQENYPLMNAVDQSGEQTINKNAKKFIFGDFFGLLKGGSPLHVFFFLRNSFCSAGS